MAEKKEKNLNDATLDKDKKVDVASDDTNDDAVALITNGKKTTEVTVECWQRIKSELERDEKELTDKALAQSSYTGWRLADAEEIDEYCKKYNREGVVFLK